MKIVFIGQKGIPATFGGVEYHVDRLSRELAKSGNDVSVYVRSWYTEKKMKNYRNIRLIHIPTVKTKHLDASIHSLLCTCHVLFKRYDIIHYHGIGPSFFSFIPRIFRRNIVTTIHRLDWDANKWGKWAKRFLKWGEYFSVKIPHRTLVVSTDLKKYVKEKYGKEAEHIPHGIDLPSPKPPHLIRQKYNLKGKDFILFMGRLSPEKRVDWLIQAYQNLQLDQPDKKDLRLVIAGGSSATPEYVKSLQDMTRDDSKIIFTGYVTGTEKEELLSNAMIFSLPSHLEGSPVVLLEAKSYGLCCLVSDIHPHLEILRNGIDGVLFNSDDLSDMTAKLKLLINDPQKVKKIGIQAQEALQKKPTWKDVAKKMLGVYQEIL